MTTVSEGDRELPEPFTGVRCMCVVTGCRPGQGCPHYSEHCRAHIAHVRNEALRAAASIGKSQSNGRS